MTNNEINIIVESPWKKIILVGIILIVFVIAKEMISGYINTLSPASALYPIVHSVYTIIIVAIVFVVILVIILFSLLRNKKGVRVKENKTIESRIDDKDIKRVLIKLDSLLEKLPEEEINKFAKSKDGNLYRDVLKKYGVR